PSGLRDHAQRRNSKLLYASNAVSDLIMTGVLERYPRLKFVHVENEVSWIPFYLTQYDKSWGRGNLESPSRCFPASTSTAVLRQVVQRSTSALDLRHQGQQQSHVVQ